MPPRPAPAARGFPSATPWSNNSIPNGPWWLPALPVNRHGPAASRPPAPALPWLAPRAPPQRRLGQLGRLGEGRRGVEVNHVQGRIGGGVPAGQRGQVPLLLDQLEHR